MNASGSDRENRVALFQKREIRRTIHNNAWWFVITDIIAALTDAIDPSDYWKKMRKRDPDLGKVLQGGGHFVPPLALEFATAGRPQKTPKVFDDGMCTLIDNDADLRRQVSGFRKEYDFAPLRHLKVSQYLFHLAVFAPAAKLTPDT